MSLSPTDSPPACSCPEPGWCERHGIHKHAHWHHLCQTRDGYRAAWDAGVGPGQNLPKARDESRATKALKDGWGDRITSALKKIGITEERYKDVKAKFGLPPTCGCPQRREWLNRIGRWWNGEDIDHAD